jgi:hypothetical protein
MSATNPDQMLRYKGFTVEIRGVDGAPESENGTWSSVTGGATAFEIVGETVSPTGARSFVPGKAYVTDLVLEGYMTGTRKALLTWMQNSAKGTGDLRADVTITPILVDGTKAPPHRYYDCVIVRIKIPSLNSGSAEPVKEVVVLRPTRYDDPA